MYICISIDMYTHAIVSLYAQPLVSETSDAAYEPLSAHALHAYTHVHENM